MSSDRGAASRRPVVAATLGLILAAALAACGTTDEASRMTLPPLETTTTTTTTTTTIPRERFYTVKPGDILTIIAAERQVTVAAILEANPQLESEDAIQAGQILEIPANTIIEPVATEPAP